MDIKSIRLENFKGFKNATLPLKPLTVLLGPNSAGKSSFGQALVALSKSNASKGIPSLKFDPTSSVEFGSYSDLVHQGNADQPVIIELGLTSGKVTLAFGKANKLAGVNELDLESFNYDILPRDYGSAQTLIPIVVDSKNRLVSEVKRNNISDWTVINANNEAHFYKLDVDGVISITSASDLTVTTGMGVPKPVPVEEALPGFKLKSEDLGSLLRSISYLRPDRHKPERSRPINPSDSACIDDWGGGTDLFIYKNRDLKTEVFFFPHLPLLTKEEAKKSLSTYSQLVAYEMEFLPALTKWLTELDLASFLDVKSIDRERLIQLIVTPSKQKHARPLTDVGFGLSQVLPILAKGLSLEKNGLLVVEQPEAQLHPSPQAALADFFCSMVKCTRNVLVETHSIELFHRLRLRASMDDELAQQIAVYFIHEPQDGHCSEPIAVPLLEKDELDWPKGFLPEGIKKEMEILATRLAARKERVK